MAARRPPISPRGLPDPKLLAIKAHKAVQVQLFAVHFRDVPGMMNALQIDYDAILAGRYAPAASAPPPAALPTAAEKPVAAPSPAPAAAAPAADVGDEEAPAA